MTIETITTRTTFKYFWKQHYGNNVQILLETLQCPKAQLEQQQEQQPTQTHKHTNKQTNKQANKRANKQTNKQTKKQRNNETKKQTNKQPNKQTNKQRNNKTKKQRNKKGNKGTRKQRNKQTKIKQRKYIMTYETNYYWHIFILTSSELTLGSCTGVEALAVCPSAKAPMGLAFDWPGSTRMPGHPPLQSAQGLPDGAGNPWRQGLFDDASGRKQSVRVSLLQSKSPLAKGGWPRRQRRDCNINSFLCSLSSPCFFQTC